MAVWRFCRSSEHGQALHWTTPTVHPTPLHKTPLKGKRLSIEIKQMYSLLIADGTVMYTKFSSSNKHTHKHPKNHLLFWQVDFENALDFLVHINTLGSWCKLGDSTSVTFLKYEAPLEAAPTNCNYHPYDMIHIIVHTFNLALTKSLSSSWSTGM